MQTPEQSLDTVVRTLLGFFAIPYDDVVVHAAEPGGRLTVSLTAPEGNVLIGKGGQNLKALEHVVRMMMARQHPEQARGLIVDINDYRQEMATELATSTRVIAERVRQTRQPEALRPMTAYERRIVHTELASFSDLTSESVGQDPHRRVVIRPL
ncbi:MAG TPA: R3H domain-containing nucleic acid-binding protein [Candidatus Paceibacterota bacterium]|nr:R3H domain-containing nucleic acid-binding protein [Candidatus Paceibacterota bacterium]